MTDNQSLSIENAKELIITAVEQLGKREYQILENYQYEQRELKKWAVEQAVASKANTSATAAMIVTEAKLLLDFVEG